MTRAPRVLALAILAALLTGAAPTPEATPDPVSTATPTPTPSATPTPEETEEPTIRDRQYWIDDYGISDAWETSRGAGVTIAVIDTGIVDGPSEFEGAVIGGKDVSGLGTADGRTPVDVLDRSHGSWVASLAAARGGDDPDAMIGVAPEASLLSVSLAFRAAGAAPFAQQIADAVVWSVDNGADIINLSLTTNDPSWDESWDDAFLYAMQNDVVVVVAAGNRGSGTESVGAPATIPGVLTVAGVDPDGKASDKASTQGITIGVSAPSENLLGVSADDTIDEWNGTSGAAPIVAGVAALVRSAHPELSAVDVINRIVKTATKPADADAVPDAFYGYGLVNAEAAVNADVAHVTQNPMGSLERWIDVYRREAAGPQPTPTVTPVEVAPLPPADAPTEAGASYLPSQEELRYGTLPLVALSGAGILVVLGVIATVRRVRSARVRRSPSKP
ncbi:S8 family serine peptidase [Microbacterium marinilacus]|uniref:Peptidase S8/S53 domain-containing protein n=1 Tax=Microbacterium marinilacus TaxID=415209 RepID=A0ABP7B7V9_9MICO|nr:S8 family serine peptidase [Microbacterium marinilacus]MBY0687410.1 S8 family serine peptidase [Microbacterium marinilacus]